MVILIRHHIRITIEIVGECRLERNCRCEIPADSSGKSSLCQLETFESFMIVHFTLTQISEDVKFM
jgi:hypothetical protein